MNISALMTGKDVHACWAEHVVRLDVKAHACIHWLMHALAGCQQSTCCMKMTESMWLKSA